jgi:hypothetical protein
MRAILVVLLAAAVSGCGGDGSAASLSDSTAKELKQKLEQMFKDIDSGNFAGLKMWADKDAVLFDFDETNTPVAARGAEGLDKFLAAYDAAVRKGLTIKTTISKEDCEGDDEIGYCTVEYDQAVAGSPEPFRLRGTLIAARTDDGWRWVHWHSSFRAFPKPAETTPPPMPAPEAIAPAPEAPTTETPAPTP